MHPEWLVENLAVIERATAAVCAHASLRGADAEDFASMVKVALLDNDCAILRKWEGRSSLATYLTIVIRRMLIDHQRGDGRFYASTEAQRRGEAAVLLERLVARDQHTMEDALVLVRARHPELTAAQLDEIARSLPCRRPRPRLVPIGDDDVERFAAKDATDERLRAIDRARRAEAASGAVRRAMASMNAEDRLILRLRFEREQSIADIARTLGVPQRPLYRRVESLLATLRGALEREGLDATQVTDLIGAEELDFSLGGKESASYPSIPDEGSEASGL